MDDSNRDERSKELEEDGTALQGLIYNIFQLSRDSAQAFVMGIVSPGDSSAAGMLVHDLAQQLGSYPANRVLQMNLAYVARTVSSVEDLLSKVRPTASANIFELSPASEEVPLAGTSVFWHGSALHRRWGMDALRERFQYVLVECPPLQATGDALGVAPVLDGFLMIIEGGKTTTQELQAAEHAIESAGGKLYGSILNRQKTVLPRWAARLS